MFGRPLKAENMESDEKIFICSSNDRSDHSYDVFIIRM
jgi:hypothetical protein